MSKDTKPAAPKPRLGRGLSSLISTSATLPEESYAPAETTTQVLAPEKMAISVPGVTPREIPIQEISPNPYQPRREFNPEELKDLCDSIVQQGILQPLIVAAAEAAGSPSPYVLIAGERRLRAAKLAGLSTVPCVVKHASAQQMMEWAMVENLQRADLNPIEKGHAYREYMDRFNLTQVQAAERMGQARATVANLLRILDLCDEVQKLIVQGKLSFGHAKVLASLTNQPERQIVLATKVVQDDLSVRQLEGLIAVADGAKEGQPAASKGGKIKPPYLRDLEEQLTQAIGTKVNIVPGRAKNTGRIVIDYYSLEDFERISGGLGLKIES